MRIRLELCEGQLWCAFDQRLLKQALLNLMLNATQAMHNAGTAGELIMRTARSSDADLGEVACVHVIDTGPGIAPDVLEKIFTPYFTTKSGGTGLGLPTARRYIEEHGGRLDVNTKPGVGSDFCVVLPALASPVAST